MSKLVFLLNRTSDGETAETLVDGCYLLRYANKYFLTSVSSCLKLSASPFVLAAKAA